MSIEPLTTLHFMHINKHKGQVNIHWGLGPVQKAIGHIFFSAKIIIELELFSTSAMTG